MVCDFCSSNQKPLSTYEAESFEMPLANNWSDGAWAACASCSEDIDSGNRQNLLDRAVDSLIKNNPSIRYGNAQRSMLLNVLKATHEAFFMHRLPGKLTMPETQSAAKA
jgi:hypothetical protein